MISCNYILCIGLLLAILAGSLYVTKCILIGYMKITNKPIEPIITKIKLYAIYSMWASCLTLIVQAFWSYG